MRNGLRKLFTEHLRVTAYTGCPAKKYIQLKMFIFEKLWTKFKQNFHGCKIFHCLHFEVFIDYIFWDIIYNPLIVVNFEWLLEHVYMRPGVNSNQFEISNRFEKSFCLHDNFTTANLEISNPFQKLFRLHGDFFQAIARF